MQNVIEELSKAERQVVEERVGLEETLKQLELEKNRQITATKERYWSEVETTKESMTAMLQEELERLVSNNQTYLAKTFEEMESQMKQKKELIIGDILKEVQELYGHF